MKQSELLPVALVCKRQAGTAPIVSEKHKWSTYREPLENIWKHWLGDFAFEETQSVSTLNDTQVSIDTIICIW